MGKFEAQKPQKNKRKRLMILATVECLVLAALVIGLIVILMPGELEGTWYAGDRMTYRFSKNGKGLMVLEDDLAVFNYKIKGETLHIDFVDDAYEDCSYQFSVKKDTLILQTDTGEDTLELTRR